MSTSPGIAGYLAQINTSANTYGCPPSLLSSVINTESGGNPGAVSPTGVQGLAQITQATWQTLYGPDVPYSTDSTAQLNAAAKLLGGYSRQYGGNQALVAAAYNGGPEVANLAQQYIDNGANPIDAISTAAGNVYGSGSDKQTEVNNYVQKVTNGSIQGGNSQSSTGSAVPGVGVDDSNPAAAIPVEGSTASVTQEDLNPPLVIMAGLDETPWFSDPDILQVNGATHAVPEPVTFGVSYNQSGTATLPVQIRLNASLSHINRSMKHVVTPRQTMTGVSLTFWGMHPDLISGTGSTGMFMNRLGITDFLNVSDLDAEVESFINQGWGDNSNLNLVPDNMRVAAKDAFVELLFTFKNNGIVWFRNPNYTGYTSGTDNQLGNDAWSPETGSSTFQNLARRNDVMTRGYVAMYFRNSVYYGYFKSLTWTADAKKPFSWDFTFVFQVERTVTVVPTPVNGS